MTDFFRSLLEDSLEKLDEPVSQLTTLKLQLEQDKWRHQQEIKELKHNYGMCEEVIQNYAELYIVLLTVLCRIIIYIHWVNLYSF